MFSWKGLFTDSTLVMLGAVLLLVVLFWVARVKDRWRKPLIFIAITYGVVYMVWRVAYTLPLNFGIISAVLGILLLLAELVGLWQATLYRMLFLKPYRLQEHSLSEWPSPPTVDVLIATYNEGLPLLKRTIIACLNLEYPSDRLNVYLCDDGRRAEAQALCEELGIHYLSREDNLHAKAGNINHALAETNGEYILLLDADMAPKSNFLLKTIGYFVDEKVGFVQTPQMFYNPDPFQFNLHFNHRIPNEQDFFMLDIQAGRANFNAVLHVGTNAVFSRKALEAIGNIPTGTITEDMATGMLLQAKGYRTVFIREILCTGLSVERFGDLIRQRERWCRGNIQVAKQWNPLTLKGLSAAQRFIYLDGLVYWFFGVQKMIYLLVPLIYLIFGTIILNASLHNLLLFWLPAYLASFLSIRALSQKSRSITWSHIYEVAMAPYLAVAALAEALFSKPIRFHVTPKGQYADKTTFAFRSAMPFLLLLALTLLGWVLTGARLAQGTQNLESSVINLIWSVYNAAAILISILVCIERPRKRTAERIDVDGPSDVRLNDQVSCKLVDISEAGAKIECDPEAVQGIQSQHSQKVSGDFGEMDGRVEWKKKEGDKTVLGVSFQHYTTDKYKKLMKIIVDRNKGYHGNRK